MGIRCLSPKSYQSPGGFRALPGVRGRSWRCDPDPALNPDIRLQGNANRR